MKPNPWTSCTAQKPDGSFCDRSSLPGAPFPICRRHAAMFLEFLNKCAPTTQAERLSFLTGAVQSEQGARSSRPVEQQGIVYYLQVGKLIKIGHTENLAKRMKDYPPDSRLLATERGGLGLEGARLRQFAAHLRHGSEWFDPAPALLAFIAQQRMRTA